MLFLYIYNNEKKKSNTSKKAKNNYGAGLAISSIDIVIYLFGISSWPVFIKEIVKLFKIGDAQVLFYTFVFCI